MQELAIGTAVAVAVAAVVVNRLWSRSMSVPAEAAGDLEELAVNAGGCATWAVVALMLLAVAVLAVAG